VRTRGSGCNRLRRRIASTHYRVTYCRMNHPRRSPQPDSKMPCLRGRLLNGGHQPRLESEKWEAQIPLLSQKMDAHNTKQSTGVKGVEFINPGDPESRKKPSSHVVPMASKGGKSCSTRGCLILWGGHPVAQGFTTLAHNQQYHGRDKSLFADIPTSRCAALYWPSGGPLRPRGKPPETAFCLALPLPAADSIFPPPIFGNRHPQQSGQRKIL
jgi:hypothetical protein